jgi:TolB-like protein/class 3 adenylate cyclase
VTDGSLRPRLAAILAADAVGYSRLIAQDDRATITALDAARGVFRAHIEASDGHVIDMAGDSVLAVFESAVGAVTAALAVQRDLAAAARGVAEDRQLRFRIGVHLGDVTERVDGTVYGDGVNIAARLQTVAPPGGIAVSESVRGAVAGKVQAAFSDLGPQRLRNIRDPVRTHAIRAPDAGARVGVIRWLPAGRRRSRIGIALVLVALAALGAAFAVMRKSSNPSSWPSGRATIAVLPFVNLSGDPRQEYFSNGVTEDIIAALGRFSGVLVLSQTAIRTRPDAPSSVSAIGRELGVRYVVQGSVRQADGRLRVAAELVDAGTGRQLWSDRVDGHGKDLFEIQDRIVRSIVGALAVRLTALEQQRAKAKPVDSVEAYDLVLQARELIRLAERGANRRARELLQQALAIAPNDADVYTALAHAEYHRASLGFIEDAAASFQRAAEYARKALALEEPRAHARAHAILALVQVVVGDHAGGLAAAEQAVGLNPSDSVAYGARAQALLYLGRIDEALGDFELALRLDPRDPLDIGGGAAVAYYMAGRFTDALTMADAHRRNPFAPLVRIAVLVETGRVEEARREARQVRESGPLFQVEYIGTRFKDPALTQRFQRALRTAGM